MTSDNEMSKTSADPKKKKQICCSDEGKQSKKQSDHQRGKPRVTIGVALPRWRSLKEERGPRRGTDVALFLLDWYLLDRNCRLPGCCCEVRKTHLQLLLTTIGAAKENKTEIFEIITLKE